MNGAAQLSVREGEGHPSRFCTDEERSSFDEQEDLSARRDAPVHCPAVYAFMVLLPAYEEPTARRRRRMCCTAATVGHAAALLLVLWPLHTVRTRVMLPPSAVTVDMEPLSGVSSIEAPPVFPHAAAFGSRQKQPVRKTTAPVPAAPLMKQERSVIKPSAFREVPPPSLNAMLFVPVQGLPALPSSGVPAVVSQASGEAMASGHSGSGSGASSSSGDSIASSHAASAASVKGARPGSSHGHGAANWQGLLLARLEQFKRYPDEAQERGQQGVAYLRFTMDRDGHVLASRIERSSGYDLLDKEALALMRRAQPLPKPPPEIQGEHLELVVPIQYFLSGR